MIENISNKAMLIILSSPSGGGKTSISKKLVEEDKNLTLSISATTRKPRVQEIDGIDYFFKTKSEFEHLIKNNQLLEFATIYENFYGTPLEYVKTKISEGKDVIFDIDPQGAYQIKKQLPGQTISIFIMPPNLAVLRQRLQARGQDSQNEIEYRIKLAESEMKHSENYDYIVINNDFSIALNEIKHIILNERKKRKHLN